MSEGQQQSESTTQSGQSQQQQTDDLMFGKGAEGDKQGEQKQDDPKQGEGDKKTQETPADKKKFLEGKVDPKSLEGKSDEELAKLFDAEKAKEAEALVFNAEKLNIPKEMQAPAELIDGLKEFATKNKLTQPQAQQVVDLGVKMQQKQQEQWQGIKATWRDEVKKDETLGGHKLTESIKAAESVVARFGGDAKQIQQLQDDLVFMGLGNKLSFIRFCNNIAAATKDDTMDGTSKGSAEKSKNLAQVMYPNMASENQ